ncbi:MAG TPA: hypothetical protein ENJ16_05640 [Planctomycetaceae bacterium]|nr:hypothetical protein [Planctomycetaceae bacterium]
MSPAEKGGVLQCAWQTARCLQLAGLRRRFPNEDEESLELRLARIWIGDELFEKVQAWKATLKDE